MGVKGVATTALTWRYSERDGPGESEQEELDLLRGMLPLCASCKKIRDNTGYWEQLESYLQNHLRVGYSHRFCPECAEQLLLLAKKGTD